jgi:multidrug transporter EmrE-like cation transporter
MATSISAAHAQSSAMAAPRTASRTSALSIVLILLCTVVGAAAQILMREGANYLPSAGSEGMALSLLTNWPLLAGYVCLGLNTGLLVLALRKGQLSVLYPIIALTYVWVAILSPMFFEDSLNALKVAGVVFIVGGVSLIGLGSRQ